MKKLYNFLKSNWKTSIAGLLLAVAAYFNQTGYISTPLLTLITTIVASIGFIFAKDHKGNKNG